MAAKTGTYTLIASTTTGSNVNTVTFSSIPVTYTDLVLVINAKSGASTGNNPVFQLNSDAAGNYSYTFIGGNGTTASSGRTTNASSGVLGLRNANLNDTTFSYNSITQFMDYANTTTYKTVISRSNDALLAVEAGVNLWRSTAAINRIDCIEAATGSFATGSTLKLYGIEAGNL